ncbi:MAG: glycosyltransferase [Steroidobacteraceae bacterium]|jgi:glycosyltransferase involved in cell wall biosynthesis
MLSGAKSKLCIVNPYEHGGGAEYQIGLLIDALVASERYDVHYLTHFVDQRDRQRNYHVEQIGNGGPIPRLGYLMDARALWRKLSEINPSVIYQRVACAYTGICAAYARRRSVPLLWHVAHDTDVSPRLLDPGRNIVRVRLEKWAVDFGARHSSHIIVQTTHQAELLRTNFSRTADAVIPNFHPPAAEVIDKSGPLTVIWIANLKPWKRPEVFVRLAQALSGNGRIQFVMVGAPAPQTGNQRWQEPLMRDIANTGNLRYVGHRSYAEVNELLSRAHIFVNTSVYEGFPNTFIQSWLRDAVVVSLSVDPDRVLEQKQVGIIAQSESELAAAVRELADRADLRAGYVKRGRDHANLKHSLKNAQDLVGLIDRIRDTPCLGVDRP